MQVKSYKKIAFYKISHHAKITKKFILWLYNIFLFTGAPAILFLCNFFIKPSLKFCLCLYKH